MYIRLHVQMYIYVHIGMNSIIACLGLPEMHGTKTVLDVVHNVHEYNRSAGSQVGFLPDCMELKF